MELKSKSRIISLFTFCFFSVFIGCNLKKNSTLGIHEASIIVYKRIFLSDSTSLFLYKIDGRSLTVESYIGYTDKDLCSYRHDDFIVSGAFDNFTISNDTIFLVTIYQNCIDFKQKSNFYFEKKQVDRFNTMRLNFETVPKIFFSNSCE